MQHSTEHRLFSDPTCCVDTQWQYAVIVDNCRGDLLRAARRLCAGNDDKAQDFVQDALVRGYEAFRKGRFAPGSNAKAWLRQIMVNNFINAYRRSRRWDSGITVDELTSSWESGPAATHAPISDLPEHRMLCRSLDEPVEAALSRLPCGLRECVILVDIEGLEYSEAAEVLRVPVGTVRSRLFRGRGLLSKSLRPYARAHRLLSGDAKAASF
jgi:RNA polymerase sigma-70 factor (ECF subfamily)